MHRFAVSLLLVTVVSCAGMMIDDGAGQMRSDGTITPCGTFHSNAQACGNARWNAKVIGQVEAGQTKEQARAIMKREPEAREIDGSEERWSYLTDYEAEMMTVIIFTDGRARRSPGLAEGHAAVEMDSRLP